MPAVPLTWYVGSRAAVLAEPTQTKRQLQEHDAVHDILQPPPRTELAHQAAPTAATTTALHQESNHYTSGNGP